MKNLTKVSACSLALLCGALAVPAWAADDVERATEAQRQNPPPPTSSDLNRQSGSATGSSDYQHQNDPSRTGSSTTSSSSYRQIGSPTSVNKASSIVGMEVRNQADEKLGKIEDLVVDLESGRISYAVLSTGGMFRSKTLAVPVSAFSTGADQKYLILNADKSRLEAATGLEKDQWPSVSNPVWGADQFWHDRTGMGTDRSSTGTDRLNPPTSDRRYQTPQSGSSTDDRK